tara:strand:+ start:299 stop:976 length:678 start_codon:yes stop_codon:yes gene_type:complete
MHSNGSSPKRFNKVFHALLWSGLALVLMAASSLTLAGEAFVEGVHYQRIDSVTAERPKAGDPVEVQEIFSYGCIHCYSFDPELSRWQQRQTEGVAFSRLPAVFSPEWDLLARIFYTAEVLRVGAQLHEPLFEAIHVQRLNVGDETVLARLFEDEAGVKEDDFRAAYEAFSVRSRVLKARGKVRTYGVTGVPTMIVNGKYRVSGRTAGSNVAMLEVVDFLVAKEAQ